MQKERILEIFMITVTVSKPQVLLVRVWNPYGIYQPNNLSYKRSYTWVNGSSYSESRVANIYFLPLKTLTLSLTSLDSAFKLQEYILLLTRLDVHDVNSIVTVSLPGNPFVKDITKEVSPEIIGKEGEKDVDIGK